MSNAEQNRGSSITIDPQQLPEGIRSIGVAFNFDRANAGLQQELVNEIHDGLNPSCTSSEKEATEQLILQLLDKASPTVSQHEVERADQDLDELLNQIDSEVRLMVIGALRRRNAAITSQSKRQADSALRQSSGPKRRARVKFTSAEVVQAVASLDTGKGITNAQLDRSLGISRPKASSLLKAATESGLLESSEPRAGVSTRYWVPRAKPAGTTSDPPQ